MAYGAVVEISPQKWEGVCIVGAASAPDDAFRRQRCYPEVDADRFELIPCFSLVYGVAHLLEVGVADVAVADDCDADTTGGDGPEEGVEEVAGVSGVESTAGGFRAAVVDGRRRSAPFL